MIQMHTHYTCLPYRMNSTKETFLKRAGEIRRTKGLEVERSTITVSTI